MIFMQVNDTTHNITSIVQSQKKLKTCAIPCAEIINFSTEGGWIVQNDLGDQHLLKSVTERGFTDLYQDAIQHIIRLQTRASGDDLPYYAQDDFIREANLFVSEFVTTLPLSRHIVSQINYAIRELANEIAAIPTTVVHKDYHSSNLIEYKNKIHVIDQQDMCIGPWTYDIASLLFDCYISWSDDIVNLLANDFVAQHSNSYPDFYYSLHLTALQRHLKCLGLFMRLGRTGKPRYLSYLPRIKNRIIKFCDLLPKYAIFKIPIEASL